MNVTCPNCATVYRIDPAKVPEAGVRARCAVCSAVFAVQRERATAASAAATASPSAAFADAPPAPPPPPAPVAAPAASWEAPAATSPAAAPEPAATIDVPPPPPPRPPTVPPRPSVPPAGTPTTPPGARPPVVAPRGPGAPAIGGASRPAAPRPVNPFLSQDPSLKARRLARALISDMVVYHPAKRKEGLKNGTLKALFEEEIKKSWEEFAEQVGKELAESTPYFREALNEILADGQQVF